jgi:hypothetical protein
MPAYRARPDGIQLDLRVTPRSSRTAVGGLHGERLIVRVSAPPVDGAANEAVREAVAEAFDVARGAVQLVRGETGRDKTVAVLGDAEALVRTARALCGESDGPGDGPSGSASRAEVGAAPPAKKPSRT